jgi:hypothetical protein
MGHHEGRFVILFSLCDMGLPFQFVVAAPLALVVLGGWHATGVDLVAVT